jgi:MFS family permease
MRQRHDAGGADLDASGGRVQGAHSEIDSTYAWWRLVTVTLLAALGGVGTWSVVVALPAVQREFGVARADASFPYLLTLVCVGFGGVLMGRLSDRFGIMVPVLLGTLAMAAGYGAAGSATSLSQFSLAQGLLIGVGPSATFGPLMAEISQWFKRHRGIAVAICASGNYIAGAMWSPVIAHLIATDGWRYAYQGIAMVCAATMVPLALLLRRRPAALERPSAHRRPHPRELLEIGVSPMTLQALLIIAGLACCIAMAMPQVHMVAYCSDLGYGPARGAQMLAVMLGFGIVSRIGFGALSDRIGGLRTLLLGSVLQLLSLFLFLPFDGLVSLFFISGLFGLVQGGIVPAYAIIIRRYFPPLEAGARVGAVMMATLFGMALGGWMSGAIFDWTGSYNAAFVNGILWSALNVSIAAWLLRREWRTERRVLSSA